MYASLRAASLTVGLAAASVSSAQTTPQEFYEELQALYDLSGMTLSAESTEMDGDTLIARGLTMDMSQPEVEISVSLGDMTIVPIDDPEFDLEAITPSPLPITISFNVVGVDNASGTIGGVLTYDGVTRIGGTPEERVMQSDLESMSFSFDTIDIPEADIPPFDLVVDASNATVRYVFSVPGETYSYTSTMGDLSMSGNMTVEGTTFDLAMTERNIVSEGSGPIVDSRDAAALFGNAVPTIGKGRDDGVEMTLTGSGEVPFSFAMTTSSTEFDILMGKGGVDISGVLSDYAVTMSSAMMPIPPVDVKADTYDFRLAIPLVPFEEVGLAALRLNMDGVTVSESLWSMFDPAQLIPRDPATILVDITSASNALIDITDPVAQMGLMGMPFRFDDVKLNDLKVAVGGAEITGTGEAEINNDGPFPMPAGAADFRIAGVNGLIEKLIDIGIMQPEQAMPAQMMLGMFAKPGDEPDVFTSRVEMGADGSITANGIPLQ